jgi:hypothetical protein
MTDQHDFSNNANAKYIEIAVSSDMCACAIEIVEESKHALSDDCMH